MEIEIIHQPRQFDIYGFSAIALEKDYAGTAFQLMDKMWQTVRKNALKNKGMNILSGCMNLTTRYLQE